MSEVPLYYTLYTVSHVPYFHSAPGHEQGYVVLNSYIHFAEIIQIWGIFRQFREIEMKGHVFSQKDAKTRGPSDDQIWSSRNVAMFASWCGGEEDRGGNSGKRSNFTNNPHVNTSIGPYGIHRTLR